MTGPHRGRIASFNTWYPGQSTNAEPNRNNTAKCLECGMITHLTDECQLKQKLCFKCKLPGHINAKCPNKTKFAKSSQIENDEIMCFLGKECALSNLNTEFPVVVDGLHMSVLSNTFNIPKPPCLMMRKRQKRSWKVKMPMRSGHWARTSKVFSIGSGNAKLCKLYKMVTCRISRTILKPEIIWWKRH